MSEYTITLSDGTEFSGPEPRKVVEMVREYDGGREMELEVDHEAIRESLTDLRRNPR